VLLLLLLLLLLLSDLHTMRRGLEVFSRTGASSGKPEQVTWKGQVEPDIIQRDTSLHITFTNLSKLLCIWRCYDVCLSSFWWPPKFLPTS